MYRNANISDLINRFEVTTEDFDEKFVRSQPSRVRHSGGNEIYDENRSIMKFGTDQENFFDRSAIFVQKSNMSMSGAKEFVKQLLYRISMLLEMISKFPFPRMSVMSFGLTSLLAIFIAPRGFTEKVLYPGFKIIFTIIYPAYRSFKAVRNKNLKEYLKWIVYWIVFAFFTCIELVTDALLHWFPFYYEIKIIMLIWLLGPSSRGSMKVYKNCIHPMLISREQEIDDMIQLAQEHGYMHVLRLSSKSVNYANKIIMQDSKSDSFMVSHQLMRNISLSNVSDAGTIQSNEDAEEILRMRRFSAGKIPIYGNQLNYSYENLETRRKPSFDYKYEDMSSDYASPTASYYRAPQPRAFIEECGEISDYRNLSRKHSMPENIPPEIIPRKASINELSDDEIVLAYNRLQMQKNSIPSQSNQQQQIPEEIEKKTDVKQKATTMMSDENYQEFLRWKEMKRINEQKKSLENEKVKPSDDDDINVVEVKSDEDQTYSDFDDFKDAISDEIESDESLKVPLVIVKENELNEVKNVNALIPTVIEENISNELKASENNVVDAKLMLSNDPLKILTNLSTSNMSLASIKSTDENGNKKRPATHKKGPAPPPPPPASTSNVMPSDGFYYDELTKKQFKETEL